MNTIVVGIDESTGAQRALEWALGEATLRQAPVRLVHVSPAPHAYYPYSMIDQQELEVARERAEKGGLELLESALAKAGGEPEGVTVELRASRAIPS